MSQINQATIDFLADLQKNNNRPWFNKHKKKYLHAYDNAIAFTDALLAELGKHDNIEVVPGKKALFRIYRDVRFSRDKTPYNPRFAGSFKRATKYLRGGYYFRISPGNDTTLVGGFWGPNTADMKRIRQEIDADDKPLREILAGEALQNTFGGLIGGEVKTAPKGFSKDHPSIDLIRKKQFLLKRDFTDKEVTSPHFLKEAVETYRAMRPFFDYMSEVLTTDANGMPIV